MQGWGTVLGVPLSFIALILTYRLLRHEVRTRRAEEVDAREAQARLVWGEPGEPTGNPSVGWTGVQWTVHNRSPAPIFNADVFLTDAAGDGIRGVCDDLPSVINPGEQVSGRTDFIEWRTWPAAGMFQREDHSVVSRLVSVNVIYDDNNGSHWTRNGSQAPVRSVLVLPPNELPHLLADYFRVPRWLRHPSLPRRNARERLEALLRRRLQKRRQNGKAREGTAPGDTSSDGP
jgi:hypothetical protein